MAGRGVHVCVRACVRVCVCVCAPLRVLDSYVLNSVMPARSAGPMKMAQRLE